MPRASKKFLQGGARFSEENSVLAPLRQLPCLEFWPLRAARKQAAAAAGCRDQGAPCCCCCCCGLCRAFAPLLVSLRVSSCLSASLSLALCCRRCCCCPHGGRRVVRGVVDQLKIALGMAGRGTCVSQHLDVTAVLAQVSCVHGHHHRASCILLV